MEAQSSSVVIGMLVELGWRHARSTGELAQQVRTFQGAWLLGTPLKVDGAAGAFTCTALGLSVARKRAGKADASPNFSFGEFACQCGGRCATCQGVLVLRSTLIAGERLHDAYYSGGLEVVSGYRCPDHNRAVGGKPDSQHQYGAAMDVAMIRPTADVARLGVWSGIGFQKQTGLVRHVDVRHASGNNPTHGSPARPTTWIYC